MVDQRCRESEGKAKIEGYMSVSDEEAHQRYYCKLVHGICLLHQKKFTAAEIRKAHIALVTFVEEFELMYYQRHPGHLHFVCPSIHTLVHCAPETARVGPLCLTTQWPIE